MALLLIRLKLRLMRNSFRGETLRGITFALGALAGLGFAALGFAVLATARTPGDDGSALAVLVCTSVAGGWLFLPLFAFGTDETLDPGRLALFPIPPRRLLLGMFGAAFVGVPAVMSTLALLGALVGYSTSPAAVPLVAYAVAVTLGLCVATSRLVTTALAPLLRSRRARDLTIAAGSLVGVGIYLAQFTLLPQPGDPAGTGVDLDSAARPLRWTPPGLAAQAMADAGAGRYAAATLRLAGATVVLAAVLGLWGMALRRALGTGDTPARTPARAAGPLVPRALRAVLPRNRFGAIAARELRYLARDPRRRAQVIGLIVLSLLAPLGIGRDGGGPGLVYAASWITAIVAIGNANMFGMDGPPLWMHVVSGGADPRGDIAARNAAWAIVVLPFAAVQTLLLAGLTGGWAVALPAYAVAVGTFGVATGIANVVAAVAPFPVPQVNNPFATGTGGRGCVTAFATIGGLLLIMVLMVPVGVLAVLGQADPSLAVLAGIAGLSEGTVVWLVSLHLASKRLVGREPELLAAVTPRHTS